MEQQLPMALQVALYAGSVAIVVLATVLIALLLQVRRQIERVVRAVEDLKAEVNPLVQEARVIMEGLRRLSGRVQGRWMEVENAMDTAKTWSKRVNHLVAGVGSMVQLPILAASLNVTFLRKGLETFVRVLFNPKPQSQQKARES